MQLRCDLGSFIWGAYGSVFPCSLLCIPIQFSSGGFSATSNEQREKECGCGEESHVKEAHVREVEPFSQACLQSFSSWTGVLCAQRNVFFSAPLMPGCDCAHPALCSGTSFPREGAPFPPCPALATLFEGVISKIG